MWRNDTKCKYMFMFPLKNLACKGLIKERDQINLNFANREQMTGGIVAHVNVNHSLITHFSTIL